MNNNHDIVFVCIKSVWFAELTTLELQIVKTCRCLTRSGGDISVRDCSAIRVIYKRINWIIVHHCCQCGMNGMKIKRNRMNCNTFPPCQCWFPIYIEMLLPMSRETRARQKVYHVVDETMTPNRVFRYAINAFNDLLPDWLSVLTFSPFIFLLIAAVKYVVYAVNCKHLTIIGGHENVNSPILIVCDSSEWWWYSNFSILWKVAQILFSGVRSNDWWTIKSSIMKNTAQSRSAQRNIRQNTLWIWLIDHPFHKAGGMTSLLIHWQTVEVLHFHWNWSIHFPFFCAVIT